MEVFIILIVMILWFCAVMGLGLLTVVVWEDSAAAGLLIGAVAIVLFAAPVAYVITSLESDEHADVLCLRGHETWQTSENPSYVVGNVVVPGGSSTTKRWVCEEWAR